MSGFLSGLLTAVAIVATVVSGGTLGIVAGALMAVSYAASKGWIGGSVGKFFNSSTGHYLTMAVGLASAATSVMSSMSAVAPTASSAAVTTANAEANVGAASAGGLAEQGAAMGNEAAATVTGTAAQTMAPGAVAQNAAMLDNTGALAASNGLSQSQIATANSAAASTSNLTGVPSNAAPVSGTPADIGSAANQPTAAQATAAGNQSTQAAVNPAGSNLDVTSAAPGTNLSPTQMAQQGSGFNPPASAADKAGGFLSKAGDIIDKHAGLATVAGNALSGMASGAANQKMMQEQIAAQQWGNMQWQDPTQVAKLNASAAQPIAVPVGYLNRAAAVRNLMNTGGTQTAPLSGPATPTAPPPTVAPVGMAGHA